jgi:hypothetical protein
MLLIFPSPARMSLTKLFLPEIIWLFPPRESLLSDISAGDGKINNLFYSVLYIPNIPPTLVEWSVPLTLPVFNKCRHLTSAVFGFGKYINIWKGHSHKIFFFRAPPVFHRVPDASAGILEQSMGAIVPNYRNRFSYRGPPGYIGGRNRFLSIDSWAP